MLRFIWQKILNKKWLISCLLAGAVLLVAIACCNPMYTHAALQKTLTDELEDVLVSTNRYPAVAVVSGTHSNSRFEHYSSELFPDYNTNADTLASFYGTDVLSKVTLMKTDEFTMKITEPRTGMSNIKASVDCLVDMEEHINIVFGSLYTDQPDGNTYECIISERMLIDTGIVIGDTFDSRIEDGSGNNYQFKVVGVFQASEADDPYWVNDPLDYSTDLFITKNAYDKIFMQEDMITSVTCSYFAVFDYRTIKVEDIDSFYEADNRIRRDCIDNGLYGCEFNYEEVFASYNEGSNQVTVTMWVFQIPVLILLCVFIFMVSNQIISIEQGEIAMLKSRGVSKKQLIFAYLAQGGIISAAALIIGIPLGYLFCVLFGATKSFMEFSVRTSIEVKITGISLLFALIAALAAVLFMTLPVFKYANFSIVEQKLNKKKNRKPLWQKVFLDFILLAVSLYGFYSFNKQKEVIIKDISGGSSIDPLLYFSSTVFILAIALIFLRIIPLISGLVYKIGAKKWSPANFASFMQINKSIRKQSFIIVFLILTLALGIFNATTARSINDNEEMRLKYNIGADLVMQQQWRDNSAAVKMGYQRTLEYTEPDFTIYNQIKDNVNSMTRVIVDDKVTLSGTDDVIEGNAQFMAIITDEFGKTAYMPEDATKFHWYYYLNALAENPNGAIVSRNYAELNSLRVGDNFIVYRTDKLGNRMGLLNVTVSAIVDAWPGYESKVYGTGADGQERYLDNYLVVVNFNTAWQTYGVEPYQIWINTDDTDFFYEFAEENSLVYSSFTDAQLECDEVKEQPFFQVTSGMLTITFFVVLILCMIGFLIYWVTSIKSRELIFGIYRAMGMSMREIIQMLFFEHLFGSLIPIIYGILAGILSAKMFVPLIQLAYSPTYSTLETKVITSAGDMFNLGLCVVLMLVICFAVIGKILSGMKIAQALKLGED